MSNAPEKAAQAMTYLQQNVPEEYGKYLQFTGSLGKIGNLPPITQELILVSCAVASQCDMCITLNCQKNGPGSQGSRSGLFIGP